jgi:hypothetical protein
MWGTIGVALALLSACGNGDGSAPTGNPGSVHVPDCEGRGEEFSAGMIKQSNEGAVEVVLVRADVAPPAQGINTWTLRANDSAGLPIVGANVTATFLMPDHTHPARLEVAKELEPGVYEVALYFSMPGLWQTTVRVTPADASAASVVFAFCVQ